jgi:integrase
MKAHRKIIVYIATSADGYIARPNGGGFHSMRHGAASSLLADGATPAVVQRQLRHSDARITLGIYGHVVGDEQRSAVQNRSTRLAN